MGLVPTVRSFYFFTHTTTDRLRSEGRDVSVLELHCVLEATVVHRLRPPQTDSTMEPETLRNTGPRRETTELGSCRFLLPLGSSCREPKRPDRGSQVKEFETDCVSSRREGCLDLRVNTGPETVPV